MNQPATTHVSKIPGRRGPRRRPAAGTRLVRDADGFPLETGGHDREGTAGWTEGETGGHDGAFAHRLASACLLWPGRSAGFLENAPADLRRLTTSV